ncbi:LptF/LptG family permease [Terriglobus sp. TAA 43]|uniref:LptF/LptG family permease n=1 Tax=Terriglobus sp. TAA 43 TaxID=278961 RepID=UPI0006471E04|nr:LptF/LptG family permease [Terriglobus sp. TAA 43]
MRILTKYILREVLSHALLGGVLFTFVLFMRDLGHILELLVRGSASLQAVADVFFYTLPTTLILTIPMTVLVGILLGLSRLSADSEITAMRAAGVGVLHFVGIVSIAAGFGLALGLFNSLYVAPRSAAALLRLEDSLKTQQAGFEVQPRVFYEDFKNYVLYVQNTRPGQGASLWQHVFLADLTNPATPRVTTAEDAVVLPAPGNELRLHFRDGTKHETSPKDPNQYDISTFTETDTPIQIGSQEDLKLGHADTPLVAMSATELWQRRHEEQGRTYMIEWNKRLSYPVACIVLMLVGVPLGLSSRRGGKSTGFVLTVALVFVYYFFSSIGVAMAKQGKIAPVVGVWAANVVFAAVGIVLLRQMSRGETGLVATMARGLAPVGVWIERRLPKRMRSAHATPAQESGEHRAATTVHRPTRQNRFPLIFDDYMMRQFLTTFGLVLASFIMLSLIFSFFELIGDIFRNRTPLITVGDYLLNLIPYMLYNLTPLCALLAVLITVGALSRSSELTAMKASGVSLYRLIIPLLALAAILAVSLFTFDELYLPQANRRQEALRSVIKGKPAQTFLRPDRKWISGQQDSVGEPTRIFYYQFFDPDKDVFANLTVFEFEPNSFHLSRRIFAGAAHWDTHAQRWVLENGWERNFRGDSVASYEPFEVASFPEIREQPVYFKKESRQSQEMSFGELNNYIHDLQQSGFDTMRLRVQLNRKLAYPLITLVMAIFAVPFALTMGKRGSLAGFATAIGMAIAYMVVSSIFEAMGNVNALPPVIAAWSPDLLFGMAGGYLLLKAQT